MFLDNDGTVRWIYDNTPNPRLTQQVADFMAENSSLAGLSDFVLSLGISPNPYVANAEDDGYGGSSDPGYYELSWYDDVVSRVNESYNNRESNDQIVFSQDPLTGNIIADDRTVYYDMEPVSVTFNEEYMLAPGWYYYVDTTSQPHRQLKWFRIGPQDGYYASKEYLYSYGIGIQLNELAYTTFSLDHPDMKCYILDESREGFSYYLDRPGAVRFPDGHVCFIRGSELIGVCNRPILIAPELNDIRLLGTAQTDPLLQLPPLLLQSPPQVLLVLAFVVFSSIRSVLVESGLDPQAVLYIVGKQGLGKTTLAQRMAGIYERSGRPVGVIQAGATHAAVNTAMVSLRDQAVVIDDLCLSASRDTARRRIDLASKLIRQGTGTIPISKMEGNKSVELPCESSLIFTAEFTLENLSDLSRCIIVPVQKQLNIPDELTPMLIGDAIRFYSKWFCDHLEQELTHFQQAVHNRKISDILRLFQRSAAGIEKACAAAFVPYPLIAEHGQVGCPQHLVIGALCKEQYSAVRLDRPLDRLPQLRERQGHIPKVPGGAVRRISQEHIHRMTGQGAQALNAIHEEQALRGLLDTLELLTKDSPEEKTMVK